MFIDTVMITTRAPAERNVFANTLQTGFRLAPLERENILFISRFL